MAGVIEAMISREVAQRATRMRTDCDSSSGLVGEISMGSMGMMIGVATRGGSVASSGAEARARVGVSTRKSELPGV